MSAAPNCLPGDENVPWADGPNLLIDWEPRWRGFFSSLQPALARMPHVVFPGGPILLVRWEGRWQAFTAALKPALSFSNRRLPSECSVSMRAGRATLASLLLHVAGILFLIFVPLGIAHLSFFSPAVAKAPQYQVVYYSQDLPQMNDVGGAQMGASGRSGGRELYHPTQTIRFVRGGTELVTAIVDAPTLKLPRTNEPVANLLTLPAGNPGPPPAAGMHSLQKPADLLPIPAVVAAQPKIARDKLPAAPPLLAGAVQAAPDTKREIAGLKIPEAGLEQVVPPPVSAPARDSSSTPALALPEAAAVAPPPELSALAKSSTGIAGFGAQQDVLPPAPQPGGRALNGSPLGLLEAMAVAAAAPSAKSGTGNGANGFTASPSTGAGAAIGSTGSGSGGGGKGVIISSNPGSAIGTPGGSSIGALAMSPAGGDRPGYGGSGGGTGIGKGDGSGSGTHGSGPGSGAAGSGLGSGALRPGISPYPGPGGSGNGGGSGIPGLTVIGGNNIVLPGFTTPEAPAPPSHRAADSRRMAGITIIATARSGGAMKTYDTFKGARVYTVYLDTSSGTAALQYAERAASDTKFDQDLAAPEALNPIMPDLHRARLMVSCILDQSGTLRNIRVVESAQPDAAAHLLTALQHWHFRPAMRGDQPVEVDVMLGFNMDTR